MDRYQTKVITKCCFTKYRQQIAIVEMFKKFIITFTFIIKYLRYMYTYQHPQNKELIYWIRYGSGILAIDIFHLIRNIATNAVPTFTCTCRLFSIGMRLSQYVGNFGPKSCRYREQWLNANLNGQFVTAILRIRKIHFLRHLFHRGRYIHVSTTLGIISGIEIKLCPCFCLKVLT